MLACILQKRLCLLASLLSVSAWAHPWPPHLLVGQGYGHCPDGYHGLPMEHARLPTLLPQLQALPPGTYGLSDGKYLSQPQGGTLVTATADEAASLPRNLCLAWGPIRPTIDSATPQAPHDHGRLRYVDVQVSALERPHGKMCARFSRHGQPVAAGCLDAPLSSPATDDLLRMFRLGSTLRLTLDARQPRGRLSTGQAAYRIETLSY